MKVFSAGFSWNISVLLRSLTILLLKVYGIFKEAVNPIKWKRMKMMQNSCIYRADMFFSQIYLNAAKSLVKNGSQL